MIEFVTPKGNIISRRYDWHNAKYHLETMPHLNRGHDEKGLYRSKTLDEDLNLDRNVFFVCSKIADNKYECFSVENTDKDYNYLNNKYSKPEITKDKILDQIYNQKFASLNINPENIIVETDIIEELKTDRPITATNDQILSSSLFRTLTLQAYDSKCSVREESIAFGDIILLEAAHIKPKRDPIKGPNIPSNGLALSHDLHKMFDYGMWTLSDDFKVIIHPLIREQKLLGKYHNKQITPKINNNFFSPDAEYIDYHRKHEYGKFCKQQ